MQRHISPLALVRGLAPEQPVHCLRPHAAARAARWFARHFPGRTFYAVKCNPHPLLIDTLAANGVKSFDVASLAEIELVRARVPDAELAFMHPVKSREAIRRAYTEHGVRIFALDCADELDKILSVTGNGGDLTLMVRLAVPNDHAGVALSGKFGVAAAEAPALLLRARNAAAKLGVSFHVGSQCMDPTAYRIALEIVGDLIYHSGAWLDVVDVGGGFPSVYPGLTPPPLTAYIDEIAHALEELPVSETCEVWCEPGRALVAEAGSVVARVDLRKGNVLHINDGTYGSLYDAGSSGGGLVFPVRLLRTGGERKCVPFALYGPTCDSADYMPGPFYLPTDIREGDYIEFGQLGAYGWTLRTDFNGFGQSETVIVDDAPILTLYTARGRKRRSSVAS